MTLGYFRGLLALSMALGLMPAGSSAAPGTPERRETEVVDRSFPFNADGHLKLNNFSGKITITGSNRANVVVHAVRRAPRERLEGIPPEAETSSSGIFVGTDQKT